MRMSSKHISGLIGEAIGRRLVGIMKEMSVHHIISSKIEKSPLWDDNFNLRRRI